MIDKTLHLVRMLIIINELGESMKFFKTISLSLIVSFSVFAAGENSDTVNLTEVPTNPVINSSNYQFPAGTGGVVLFNNGPLVSGVGTGAGGLDESILENVTLGMNTLGAGHQFANGNRVADDFTVAAGGWNITTITFYAYQTGETASTMTGVYLQIWDGVPGAMGSSIVFGDIVTNRMSSTTNSNILRVVEGDSGIATNRQIAASDVDVNINLAAGTYWLDWMTDGSGGSGPWAPPITIAGQTTTGNAMQFTGAWADLLDGGTATGTGLPFIINGPAIPAVPVPMLNWISMALLLLLMIGLVSRKFIIRQ